MKLYTKCILSIKLRYAKENSHEALIKQFVPTDGTVRVRKITITTGVNGAQYNLKSYCSFCKSKSKRLHLKSLKVKSLKKYMNTIKNICATSAYVNYFKRARVCLKHACSTSIRETKPIACTQKKLNLT